MPSVKYFVPTVIVFLTLLSYASLPVRLEDMGLLSRVNFLCSFGSMDLAIMTENLPEAERRSGRKGETGIEKGKRGGKGREVGIGIRREAGTRTEIGRGAKTGRGTESVMVRRKETGIGTATTEIGTGIVVNEGKGQGIEMKMIFTGAVTLTGKILFGILLPCIPVGA